MRTLSIMTVLPLFLVACVAAAGTVPPLDDALNRPTPLSFGLRVTPDPAENPIDPPERFEGYHTALDYEISEGELEEDVPVYAICRGNVVYSGFAEGYGGLLVHRCRIDGQDVTVLYGHLALEGLPSEGVTVKQGERIGILAPADSYASGGTRKHLHLGIHKGRELDVRGYVQTEEELREFVDPATVLPSLGIEDVLPDMRPYWDTGTGADAA